MVDDNEYLNVEKTTSDYLNNKLSEMQELFGEQEKSLTDLAYQKEELNKKEETIRYEMCGIHGAIVALEQLIEEVTEDKEKSN